MTDTMKTIPILLLLCLSTLSFCTTKPGEPQGSGLPGLDTPVAETVPEAAPPLIETVIEKELLYDQHTLADTVGRSFKTTGTRTGKPRWSGSFIAMLTSGFPTL